MTVLPGKDSQEIFRRAQRYMPGGVSSPVRSFQAVGGTPPIIARGQGCRLYDVDGREYIDYIGAYGPLILGHAPPEVVAAIAEAAGRGTAYGNTTELEVELARLIVEALPSVDVLRFVSSGTEATMSALRLARAATGRAKIVKFEGCYHGHADGLLAQAGSGAATFAHPSPLATALGIPASPGGVPTSFPGRTWGAPGVPASFAAETLVAPYNDLAAAEGLFRERGEEVAAVIVEPLAANMGVVPPRPGFLEGLRLLTREYGALLIFDEVITGFRLAWGGAQALYGVHPDLTCLGKVIGGGLPVGAYGGRRELMALVAPQGPVYQAGTLSGNPVAMAAGLATLRRLQEPGAYERLEALGRALEQGISEVLREAGAPARVQRAGSLLTLFFTAEEVWDFAAARSCDGERFGRFFHAMLARGLFLPPSPFEAWFLSLAHSSQEIERTVAAVGEALRETGPAR